MLRFSLCRIPILIHPSVWITLALFGGVWGIECVSSFLSVLYFMLAGFMCLILHELAHAVVGRFFGGGHPHVLISGLGGECCNPDARMTRFQGLLMTIAGPLSTLLLGLIAVAIIYVADGFDTDNTCARALAYIKGEVPRISLNIIPVGIMGLLRSIIMVSFWWTILNLIPIYPLDGGQIMCGLMDVRKMGTAHAVSIFSSILFFLTFFILGWWLLSVFMLILLYINFRWWRLYSQASQD